MYFWRINEIKRRLVTSPLSDREALPYLVAYSAMAAIGMLVPPENYNRWDFVSGLLSVGFTILGTIWVYRRNGGSSGTYFLQRFLAIGWVVALRLLAVAGPTLIVFYMVVSVTVEDTPGSDWYDVVILGGVELAFYQRLGSHVRDVAIGLPNMPLQPASSADAAADSK